jgi:hypothetical protein
LNTIAFDNSQIKTIIEEKIKQLKEIKEKKLPELWMYFDSGATRSVISETSPIKSHLKNVRPTGGSCSIGNGEPLLYLQRGTINKQFEITVVKDLKYDLYSAVSAAKLEISSIIDYDLETGENHSYMVDKQTGNIIPLIERGKKILEVPLQLMIPNYSAEGDTTDKETILYAFDIIALLKTKTAEAVHKVARKIQLIITARTGNKLLT